MSEYSWRQAQEDRGRQLNAYAAPQEQPEPERQRATLRSELMTLVEAQQERAERAESHAAELTDEADRLRRKVSFYVDLVNRTAAERDDWRQAYERASTRLRDIETEDPDDAGSSGVPL